MPGAVIASLSTPPLLGKRLDSTKMTENFDEQTHKLQLWIPDDLFRELGEVFPHGMRKPVFQKLAEDILDMMKSTGNPEMVCNAILAKELRLGVEFRKQK